MANKTIQLLRNSALFTTRALAISGLETQFTSAKDGQPILARYTGGDNKEHTLLGIKSAKGYEIFDNEGTSADIQAAIAALDATVSQTAGADGLALSLTEVDGVVTAISGSIAANTYDAYGAASTAETNAKAYADTKIDAMDKDASAVVGQVVTTVSEANGVVSETKANVKDLQLGGYSKDTTATGDIASTDTINAALSKLENTVGANKISNKVEKDTQASHLTLQSATAADGSVTYTIGESDIASKTDLDAEIAARKAVDGQNGDTYTANTGAKYIGGATSLNDADVKLDAALKAADESMLTGVTAGNGISVSDKSGKSQTITAVAVADDPIIEVTANGIATKKDAVWDCGSY